MSAVLYGTDADGNLVFDKETFSVNDDDFDSTVVMAEIAAGGTMESFMTKLSDAKTKVSNEHTSGILTDALLMAYFEVALGRILELHGKVTVSDIS